MQKYSKNLKGSDTREWEFDLLRIFALLAVILVHCSGLEKTELVNLGFPEKMVIFLTSIVTWQVPIFVMISGRFFLDLERKISPLKIVKSIKRLIVAFLLWNIIYQLHYIVSGVYDGLNWKGIISQALIGPYHFWFLYMLITMYAITPFLRKFTDKNRLMEYFLVLFFIFEFLTNYGIKLPYVGEILSEVLRKMDFHFALGYAGYYILGYYLYKNKLSINIERLLYICGIICVLFAGIATVWKVGIEGYNGEWYTKYLYPNVIIEASAIYYFFVNRAVRWNLSKEKIRIIEKLSKYSFGVYLIHALVNELVSFIVCQVIDNLLIRLLIILLLIYIISNILIAYIRKIPYIGKLIT